MSDSQRLPTICDAFPRIPEEALAGVLAGLPAHGPIASLMTSAGATAFFDGLADWMLRQPSTCVGSTLPGLWLARDEGIEAAELPVRVVNALARLGITVWGEVLELTPSFLLDVRGFGEGCLRQFLAAAVAASARACCRQAPPKRPPTVDLFEPRCYPPRAGFRTSQLRRLVEWAVSECRAQTIGAVFAACSQANPPEDIKLLCKALRATHLADGFPGLVRGESLGSLLDDLCGVVDSRSRTIFLSRISLDKLRTLEDLAAELGLTKERVRQLWVRAEQRVREALETPRFAPILWRAHTLRTMLGVAVPGDTQHLKDAAEQVSRGVAAEGRERALDVLLWLTGPYRWNPSTGWL
jgi:hypothetical protein